MMEKTPLDALQAFSANLCAMGLDFDGLSLEVPKKLFIALLHEAGQLGMAPPPASPFVRVPHQNSGFNPMDRFNARVDEVWLTEELITNGFKVRMHCEDWQVRLRPIEATEFLTQLRRMR